MTSFALTLCKPLSKFDHDDVTKRKHFPCYWDFAGNSLVAGEFPPKGQWRGALMSSLVCAWTNGWVNNRNYDDMRRHRLAVISYQFESMAHPLTWWSIVHHITSWRGPCRQETYFPDFRLQSTHKLMVSCYIDLYIYTSLCHPSLDG